MVNICNLFSSFFFSPSVMNAHCRVSTVVCANSASLYRFFVTMLLATGTRQCALDRSTLVYHTHNFLTRHSRIRTIHDASHYQLASYIQDTVDAHALLVASLVLTLISSVRLPVLSVCLPVCLPYTAPHCTIDFYCVLDIDINIPQIRRRSQARCNSIPSF